MKNRAKFVLLLSCCALAGCGGSNSTTVCKITAITVFPQNVTADHAAPAPGNEQQFLAFESGGTPGCVFTAANLTSATWSVSDPVAVNISNVQGPNFGKATCMAATATPVTVTATVPVGDGTTVSATSSLSCK